MKRLTDTWVSDETAQAFMSAAESAGHEAYFVGGCVRNALLGLPVQDLDLATNAHPEAVIALAKELGFKPVPTGIEHGTITIVGQSNVLEVTTFRNDVETDGRHAVVSFSDSLEDDAQRRDFRMNAIYADRRGQIIDPTGGLEDIAKRQIRFVGEAVERCREDYLRIIRLFRFAAQLGFGAEGLDAEALLAAARLPYGLKHVSLERQTAEMIKLLSARDITQVVLSMDKSGVLARVLLEANTPALLRYLALESSPNWQARLACLTFASKGVPLRLSKKDTATVQVLKTYGQGGITLQEFAYRHGFELAEQASLVCAAYYGAQSPKEAELEAARYAAEQSFPLCAQDLMPELSGRALGEALKRQEAAWIASGFQLSKESLKASVLNEE